MMKDRPIIFSAPMVRALLADEINGRGSWATNPWVVTLTFRVVHANIDAISAESA